MNMHSPAFAAAVQAFDPGTYLAGMRSLGSEFWVLRDASTGEERLQGTSPAGYAAGLAPAEFHARKALLDASRAACPDWSHQLGETLKRTGYVIEVDQRAVERRAA